ncbi:MAG TPA: hypothetical protein VES59_06315 [Bacteroidota bacterium]|nr:hypothetical protein [Bacteroidota bacterium]
MKKGKRIKPKFPIEYRLLISHRFKERVGKTVTLLALRTVNEFTSFRYEIVAALEVSGQTIRLKIHGLRAPQVTIPGTGPAQFEAEHEQLRGLYTVAISKLDREENVFSVRFSGDAVTVESSPRNKFVEIVTSEEEW